MRKTYEMKGKSNMHTRKKLSNEAGITLVALVITIIVLLILAGVVIRMAVGENGVILRAKDSANKYNESQDYEIGIMDDVSKEYDSIIGGNWMGGTGSNPRNKSRWKYSNTRWG